MDTHVYMHIHTYVFITYVYNYVFIHVYFMYLHPVMSILYKAPMHAYTLDSLLCVYIYSCLYK